jgi:hypothetical protein
MKISPKFKEAFKSYLRSVGTATITVMLALVADIKPEYAILLGAMVAPLARALDPKDSSFGVISKE